MADNRKWLNRDLKLAVSKVHEEFTHKWPDHDGRTIWVNSWSNVLSVAKIKPDTVLQASEYCITHLNNDPSLHEFREFCIFLQTGAD